MKHYSVAAVETGSKQVSTGDLHLFFRAILLLCSPAGDEARTRYLHLGKVALYRMSYTRMSCFGWFVLYQDFFICQGYFKNYFVFF